MKPRVPMNAADCTASKAEVKGCVSPEQ